MMKYQQHLQRKICFRRIFTMVRCLTKTVLVTTAVCGTISLILLLTPPSGQGFYTHNPGGVEQFHLSTFQSALNSSSSVHGLRNIQTSTIKDTSITEAPSYTMETCSPKTKVVFLKVHKTGSSTVANIFQRFGVTRDLNFAVPRKKPHEHGYNYIGKPGETIHSNLLLPIPEGESYDILWNHVTYNRTAFRSVMHPESVYISIIREPFDQFVSAFEYYKMYNMAYIQKMMSVNVTNPISTYLQNYSRMESPGRRLSYIRNKMVADFGMTLKQLSDNTKRGEFLENINKDFKLVMIMEYFDESLILLRRTLCWNHKDILYFSQNKNPFRPRRLFSSEDHRRHKELSKADYELYNYFYGKFVRKMSAGGDDFFEEVRHFRHIVRNVWDHCLLKKRLFVPASIWSEEFELTPRDCRMMRTSELTFLDKIITITNNRYNRHVSNVDRLSHD